MSIDLLNDKEFLQKCRELTMSSYKEHIAKSELENLLSRMPTGASLPSAPSLKTSAVGVPDPISADLNVAAVFLYGYIYCYPSLPWEYDASFWGPGLAGFGSTGFMYTAYNSWDAFFNETKGHHVQSAGVAGGIVQATWFNGDGIPIGQYNGIAGGAGLVEAGGSGRWKRK